VRWHLVDQGGAFDFSSLAPLIAAAKRQGIQVIWTLCHYGWPDDLDVFSPTFIDRFAAYCAATARFIARQSADVPIYSPINEISFLAFSAGETGWFHPGARDRGDELKAQLVRASIAGIEAIWAVDARARIVHVDPLVNLVPPLDRPDLAELAAGQHASQFAAWDWLAGRARPELGGHPRYLDIVGVNHYHNNQWEYPVTREHMVHLRWDDEPRDPRWVPFHHLLAAAYARYHRPIFVAETSHFGAGRARWITEMAAEVAEARAIGVPVAGICLYPILDRPDWNDAAHWHHSGLWDLIPDAHGRLQRVLVEDYAAAFTAARTLLDDGIAE
jgi:beta-glucosidase/6-phospho-beta-glucosidase/beta-galactosidase